MNTHEADAFLMGGGVPALKFPDQPGGDWLVGVVMDYEKRQKTEFGTRNPEFWPDGSPKYQIVYTLETDLRDDTLENDDGIRKLYADKPALLRAIRDAVKAAGHKGSLIGGKLGVQFSGYGEAKGAQPPKLFKAKFEPGATVLAEADEFMAQGDDTPPPPVDDDGTEPF